MAIPKLGNPHSITLTVVSGFFVGPFSKVLRILQGHTRNH
jgi:hypothetical protein